jgi:type II secretory pathway component PulJ
MHTQLAKQLRKLAQGRSTEGSTLTEMLIAGTITLAVVGASGIGVVAMVNNEQIVEAQTEQRAELNRSMDFIASEVQLSDSVEKDASSYSLPAALTSALPSEIDSTIDITPVLILKKDSLSNPVIYYSATPTGDTWNGPQIMAILGNLRL